MAKKLSEEELKKNAKTFEFYYLLPKESNGKELDIRLRVNSAWLGHAIKEDVIKGFGLEVGDTIMARVTPMFLNGLIGDGEIILFAEGDAAHWVVEHNIGKGCIIDGHIRFLYTQTCPEGGGGVHRLALLLEQGRDIVSRPTEETKREDDAVAGLLKELLDGR